MKQRVFTRRAVLAGLAATAASGRAAAQTGEADRADLARVEAYLNDLVTLRSRFLQIADNGATAEGEISLWRPGRLRVEYDPPHPILLVTVDSFLVQYDKQLKTTAYLPLDSTPAGFLVRDRIRLSGDVTVTAIERGPGSLRVTLIQTKDPRAGRMTLVFAERPLALSQWAVVDGLGATTRVSLIDPRVGGALDPALFRFVDPGRGSQPESR